MIPVTKPYLPDLNSYTKYLDDIWSRGWLTNNGPLVNELELELKRYLQLPHLAYVSNGTIALQLAVRALGIIGEVITTPFSYVATTSSIVWEGCTPVFADIDADTLNINPQAIEQCITERTTAILATHAFGNPCDVEAIEKIANRHNLKVIYDAAHCFGTRLHDQSIFGYGHASTASFHATKMFHTIEGGAVFTRDPGVLQRVAYMRNFGHNGPEDFLGIGINGKNSEFHAAMGLVNLKHFENILQKRREQHDFYNQWLPHMQVKTPKIHAHCTYNYAYYPVVFASEAVLLRTLDVLNGHWVYPRRYFHPPLHRLNYVTSAAMPVCEDICKRILCLPLYDGLKREEVDFICRLILRAQNN